MRMSYIPAATIVGALTLSSAPALAGPVQIISQDRRVTATARPGAGADPVVVNITAPDNGLFEETAIADTSGDGFITRAISSMTSRLGNDGLHFAGAVSWETQDTRNPGGADSATADAFVLGEVMFRLDEPYDYTFNLVLNVTRQSTSGAESGEGFNVVFFQDTQGLISIGDSGTLQPGNYFLQFNRSTESLVSGNDLDRHSLDYALDLNLAPSDGSSAPKPIPLPPAAFAALATFACYRASRLLLRRHRGPRGA